MALNKLAEDMVKQDIQEELEATKAELAKEMADNPEMTALEAAANEHAIDDMMAEVMAAEAKAAQEALLADMMAKEMAAADIAAKDMSKALSADVEGSSMADISGLSEGKKSPGKNETSRKKSMSWEKLNIREKD